MSIVTKTNFQRLHVNGYAVIDVPSGTKLTVNRLYGTFYKVTADKAVGRFGEMSFCVNETEYKQIVGAK